MPIRKIALFLAVFGMVLSLQARRVKLLSYEELIKMADAVVIIEPETVEKTADVYPEALSHHKPSDFQGWNTSFKVHAALKGNLESDSKLVVLHFSYSDQIGGLPNGAQFISFVLGPLEFKKQRLKAGKEVGGVTVYRGTLMWLAFLRKREDGRYEAVTNPYDAQDSFRELHGPSFYPPISGDH